MSIQTYFRFTQTSVTSEDPPQEVTLHFPLPPDMDPIYKSAVWTSVSSGGLNDELTVVTAYFNLGTFQKGNNPNLRFTSDLYHGWMTRLGCIDNPMVLVVDDEDVGNFLKKVRSRLSSSLTKIIKVDRKDLWSFNIVNSIRQIYAVPSYPHHNPNTVIPEYSGAMHAKHELVAAAVIRNYFGTKYFCWMDVGYFRDEPENGAPFKLATPTDFDTDKIAFTEVYNRNPQLSSTEIVFMNHVWLAGGYFLARGDIMLQWVKQYQNHVVAMLRMGVMSTDQQVIYSIFNGKDQRPAIEVQLYRDMGGNKKAEWFTLGYVCKRSGEKKLS